MASCARNIPTKNYHQNLIIGFQVTVENVGDVFLRRSVYTNLTLVSCLCDKVTQAFGKSIEISH